jgi:hypothetical protein
VTNGRYGVAVLEYRRGGLRANKSWFLLDDQVVCLGADITGDDATAVATSMEQSRSSGPIAAAGSPSHEEWQPHL